MIRIGPKPSGFIVMVVVLSAGFPSSLFGQNYHPLETGTEWYYENIEYGPMSISMTGDKLVLGVWTKVRHQEEALQTYENFWTCDDDGNLFLHGAHNLDDGWQAVYVPPVKMINAPLYLNSTWITEDIMVYDFDGNPIWGPFNYGLKVYWEGEVNVPAGDFYAYGVGINPSIKSAHFKSIDSHDMFGRRGEETEDPPPGYPEDWYAADIGMVRHIDAAPWYWNLVWWKGPQPTSSKEDSWGRLKFGLK
ncbi:MAG: hypothetical protein KJ927_03305 [Candidatus Eisenbacteria bacterium]|nr:hypothetical protein [Candidatus Eisenbacteria bacterium]MBU1947720.1 hypothetical protein [Candidatus Eisenbacteria bacterium]